ncbi:MAG: TIGR00159 family protein [Firmicutes bacterium]|nr:TIGR00159 family protein [Bacillota bacterium]
MGWRDIIDIVIVSYIIYRLIVLIRGTRAEQLIKGLVVLLMAMVFSNALGLRTISWIMQSLMTMSLVAIPIVFQPELRRALESLGRGRIFQRNTYHYGEKEFFNMLDEMMKSINVLVKKRLGALIVMERETGLKEIIETGIKIDGIATAELIVNIFMPRSPLHDGAVIIREDKVAAAGCFLPLTENPNLSKELGTRHRAALGLTEQSDAVAIVVSEETGVISLAHGGKLTRYLDEKTLRKLIQDLCAPKTEPFTIWPWRVAN